MRTIDKLIFKAKRRVRWLFPKSSKDSRYKPCAAYVEITSHCNFKCSFCPSEVMKRKKSYLPFRLGEKFIKEVHRKYGQTTVYLSVLGEPLLSPDLLKYFKLCNELGMPIVLITNFSLLDDKIAQGLFRYNQFSLFLSLQTPTEESYKTRGCTTLNLEQYLAKISEIIELKYKYGSSCAIEIHVASMFPMLETNPAFDFFPESETAPMLVFKSKEEEQSRFIGFAKELEELGSALKLKYPEFYNHQEETSAIQWKARIEEGTVITDMQELQERATDLFDDRCWGYMALPNVFLKGKVFGPFTKDPVFLQQMFPPDKYEISVREKKEFEPCFPMACTVAVLSDGRLTACCLDYEGELALGNIAKNSLDDAVFDKKRRRLIDNPQYHPLCRRCKGHVTITEIESL